MGDEAKTAKIEEPGRFQFGLSTLLTLTAVVAVTCSLFFRMPAVVATPLMVFITVALPAVLTVILIHGRSYSRTFCMGALFPAATMMLCTSLMFFVHTISAYQNSVKDWTKFAESVGPYYRIYVGATWALCISVGLLAVVFRWAICRDARRRGTR